jgi:PAS domain S-box-containing protein
VAADRDPHRALIDALLAAPGAAHDYAGAVRRVADAVVPRLADLAALDLVLPDGSFQRLHVAHGPEHLLGVADELRAFDPPHGAYPLADALRTGEPVRIAPIDDDALRDLARSPDHKRILRDLAPTSLLAIPLINAGRAIGVLSCWYAEPAGRTHDADVARAAADLGPLAALAISHAEVVCQRELLLARERITAAGAAAERTRARTVSERRQHALEAGRIGTWELEPGSDALHWDARCKELFGLPPETRVDRALFLGAVQAADRERIEEALAAALDPERGGKLDVEFRIVALDGGERWLRSVGQAVFDEGGDPLRLSGITEDIDDRKRIENELGEARATAEAASRAKDEFLAMLGHELRNPLAPIQTALEVIKLRDPDAFARERTVIERQVEHLIRLVDDLLDVSRITRGKVSLDRRPITFADVVAKAIEMASPLLEKQGHVLRVDVPADLRIEADEARLAQIVANLLTNAAKYTDPRGEIDVIAGISEDQQSIELRVRDTGIGITPELLPRVFDLFTQGERKLDRSQGGLGLGLTITRSLVEMHGGTVVASSAGSGRGSTFTVRLPRLEEREAEPFAEPERATTRVRAADLRPPIAARVLIVDDNREAAEVLAQALEATGFSTCVAFDAPQALDRAASFHPDVAVLDIGLPVMDGYELAKRLRELPATRSVALIALTGYGQESDHQASTEAGFTAHLVKPVELRRVTALLDRITGR